MYNFHKIIVDNCTFEHNGPSSVVKFTRFRGHSGGLSISSLSYPLYQEHSIIVKDSKFLSNSAEPDGVTEQSSSEAIEKRIFTGRGGALGFFFGDNSSSIQAEVTNCSFQENSALSWGGAFYVVFSNLSNHTINIRDCLFDKNNSSFGGGAFISAFIGIGSPDRHSIVRLFNAMFVENSALQGGAAMVFLPDYRGLLLIQSLVYSNQLCINYMYSHKLIVFVHGLIIIIPVQYSACI